ncbi:hypothetical protein BGZ80_003323 [Entomortierella chlamydospora]|uniref:Uncharacterized protein n=1 Tax=Entomortierella chlamydospora TaxID=101097 RepID=A0A9P6MP03_9FUNG|nr:hypothetical protein BGZ79_006862 [Entomortierella chlamydospora]KAG0008549.1 hypothetical protein BGZ80_003323 [Entomortierella chlamydospora]
MASIKSRFDPTPTDIPQQTDGPWLSTYSRALCSIYPKEEDDWDYLLSTQNSSIFSKLPENPTPPTNIRNKRTDIETIDRPSSTTPSLSSSLPGVSLLMDASVTNDIDIKTPLSPARISHALCKIGFDCIDYLTATQDELAPEPPRASPNTNGTHNRPVYTSPMLEDLDDSDWRRGLAAAVCGKRTAALERKRALSRSTSQVDIMDITTTAPNNGPWFEALDRLARWDEVAYR